MTALDLINQLAAPGFLVLTAFAAWALARLSTWLREKTKSDRLARVVDFAGRIAGDIHDTVQDLPPGADVAEVKAAAMAAGVAALKSRGKETIALLGGATDATLTGIVKGELGKLRATAAPATIVVPTGAQPILVTTDAPAA